MKKRTNNNDIVERRERNKTIAFDFMTTNAQSLNAKSIALADAFISLQLHCAIITETWFNNMELADNITHDLKNSFNIDSIRKDRKKQKRWRGSYILQPKENDA